MSETKIKVLLAIRQGKIGGGESHVFDLAMNLDKNKYTPIVLSFTPGPMVDNLRKVGVTVVIVETEKPFNPLVISKVRKIIQDYHIDLVHAHGTRAASNVLIASKLEKKPVVYTVHGWSFHDAQSGVVKFIRRSTEAFLSKYVELVINVSFANQNSGKSLYSNFKSKVINYGVNLDKFNYSVEGNKFRQKHELSNKYIWFALIARMTIQKDPINLIKGFYLAAQENQNIRLLLIGEGELDEEKNALLNQYNLADKVKVLPFHQNMPEVLSAIDVYCLVSLWEGLPIGLLEAMAMKKACIVSPADGIVEVIKDHENGIIVPKKNPEALKIAFLKMAENPQLIKTYGQKAFDKIDHEFSIQNMVEKTCDEYERILD